MTYGFAAQFGRYMRKTVIMIQFLLWLPCLIGSLVIFARVINRSAKVIHVKLIQFCIDLSKRTRYVMHHQFNIQQLYVLPTLYLCVLYLSENKQRLVPLTA